MGLVEQRPLIRQPIDVESNTSLFSLRQRAVPIHDLGLEFHLTPGHSTDAISSQRAAQPEESEQYCRYRQTTKLGPLRLSQELRLDRTAEGPLVNRVLTGPFSGATIGFDVRTVTPAGDRARVRATLRADLRGIQRLLAPILRRSVAQALAKALAEDKTDLEHGGYLTVVDRRSNFGHPAT